MTTQAPSEAAADTEPRRLGPLTLPRNPGPLMLLVVSAIAVGAVIWGRVVADPGLEIRMFDAGAEADVIAALSDQPVLAFPEEDLYLVGLEDGRLRAIDGRVEATGCAVEYLPDDPRGAALNPFGHPGVLEDPCSRAVWSVAGDAIALTTEPLRTPNFSVTRNEQDEVRILIEVITVGGD